MYWTQQYLLHYLQTHRELNYCSGNPLYFVLTVKFCLLMYSFFAQPKTRPKPPFYQFRNLVNQERTSQTRKSRPPPPPTFRIQWVVSELPCASVSKRVRAKPFICKCVWFAWKWTCRRNSFSYEWFPTKTRFDTEAKANSEMAYFLQGESSCLLSWIQPKTSPNVAERIRCISDTFSDRWKKNRILFYIIYIEIKMFSISTYERVISSAILTTTLNAPRTQGLYILYNGPF